MDRKLSSKERKNLVLSHRHARDGRVRDRIKAILLYDKGYTYSEIADILLLDDETVRRHAQDYFLAHKIAPENGGSQSFLAQTETQMLITHLEKTTYLYVKDICAYVKSTFDKSYSESGLTKWLRRNKFCYKKPHGVPAKADTKAQEVFIKHYEELKKSLKPGK